MVHTDCVRTEDTSPGPAAILGDMGVVRQGGFQQLDLPSQPVPWGLHPFLRRALSVPGTQ